MEIANLVCHLPMRGVKAIEHRDATDVAERNDLLVLQRQTAIFAYAIRKRLDNIEERQPPLCRLASVMFQQPTERLMADDFAGRAGVGQHGRRSVLLCQQHVAKTLVQAPKVIVFQPRGEELSQGLFAEDDALAVKAAL